MNQEKKKKIVIYTDGACSGNPGPGGWGAVLLYGPHRKELSGFVAETTNNKMELLAAVEALRMLKVPCQVELYSDSAYLINAWKQGWLANWQKNGWKNAKKQPVENQELWQELLRLARIHQVSWIKVKGHSDNEENNRCDEMARQQIARHKEGA